MYFRQRNYFDSLSETVKTIVFNKNWVMDSIVPCIIVYVALWHMLKVMNKIKKENRKLLNMFEDNKSKQADLILLRDKQREYEDVVIKARAAQKVTAKQLDDEVKNLNDELAATAARLTELNEAVVKSKPAGKAKKFERVGDGAPMPDEYSEGPRIVEVDLLEEYKILEPSFPPRVSIEPPPRKYGVFVSRPFSRQRGPSTSASPAKIGFK